MSQAFETDLYKIRLPLPLAQIYERIEEPEDDKSYHDLACQLVDAFLRLTVATLATVYLEESEAEGDEGRVRGIDALLSKLPALSLGDWNALLRQLAQYFKDRSRPGVHPLGHLWSQLDRKRSSPEGLLGLYRKIKNGVDGEPGMDQSCSALQVLDVFVSYRNKNIGHGGVRVDPTFYKDMGTLVLGAANELLAEGTLDPLGPAGSRLVSLSEVKATPEDEGLVTVHLRDLTSYKGKKFDKALSLRREEGVEIRPDRVAVLWPEPHERLVFLHPLLIFRRAEKASGEVLFINGRKGSAPEYLSYSTGKPLVHHPAAASLEAILTRVRRGTEAAGPGGENGLGGRRHAGLVHAADAASATVNKGLIRYVTVLVVATLVLIAVCAASLARSYWFSESDAWRDMYDTIKWEPKQEPIVGWGFWIEMFRTVIALVLGGVWIVGYVLRRDTYDLFFAYGRRPELPFAPEPGIVEPPGEIKRLLTWVCRAFCLLLIVFSTPKVIDHNWTLAPQKLAACNGDRTYWPAKLDLLPAEEFRAGKGAAIRRERLSPAQIDDWERDPKGFVYRMYIAPYRWYTAYSVCNFVIFLVFFMPALFYATALGLLRVGWAKNQFERALKDPVCRGDAEQIEETYGRVRDNLRHLFANQCWFLCFLTVCLAYQIWFDRYNLSPDANNSTEAGIAVIFVLMGIFLVLFGFFYQHARGLAAKSLDKPRRREFLRENKFSEFVFGDPEIMWTVSLTVFAALAGIPLYKLLVDGLGWI